MDVKCPKCHFDNTPDSKFCKKCGTQIQALEEISLPTKTLKTPREELTMGFTFAGRYQIIEELGTGGMGKVYRALDGQLNEEVAFKLIRPEVAADRATLARFSNELKLARKIVHKNVGRMYELMEGEGGYFITMEYIPGEDLRSFIRRSKHMAFETALGIACQICEGLGEAHRLGVIHRDLKPANIMIDREGNARIMDFGIARSIASRGMTEAGFIIGTPEYMSPEQVEAKETDARSDIYSLGVILFEMVTGRIPFHGETPLSVAVQHKTVPPPDPRTINARIPENLSRIIIKCLEKEKDRRYPSAGDLLSELKKTESALYVPTKEALQIDQAREIPRKRLFPFIKTGAILAAAAAVLVSAVFLYRAFHKGRPVPSLPGAPVAKRIVVLPFKNLGAPVDEYFSEGMTEEITGRLSHIGDLGVIARTSAVRYAGSNKSLAEIGQELDVGYVLEGSVQWANIPEGTGKVRVMPQLIRVSDNTVLWGEAYERSVDELFAIQSDISQRVVEKLDVTLLEPERRVLEVPPTENMNAYQAYLRARFFENRPHFSLENWNQVIQNYERAIEFDPGFGLAYAELAKAHARFYYFQQDLSEKRRESAVSAARKAMELAPDSPQVHLALSYYSLWAFRDAQKALQELDLAAKGLPSNAEVHKAKAYIFALEGRFEEALQAFEKAFELSPRDADLPTEILFVHWYTRKYPEGIKAADQAAALAPDDPWPYLGKAFVYWTWKGKCRESRIALEAVSPTHEWAPWAWFWQEMIDGKYREAIGRLSSTPGDWIRVKMWAAPKALFSAFAHVLLKEPEFARRDYEAAMSMLEEEIKEWPGDPRLYSSLGIAYAGLGRKEDAVRMGRRAVELFPLSRDAVYGIPYIFDLAFIFTMTGEYESALDTIENLLSIPCFVSPVWLLSDPRWLPLHNLLRFKRLLEKHAAENDKRQT